MSKNQARIMMAAAASIGLMAGAFPEVKEYKCGPFYLTVPKKKKRKKK